MPQQGKEIRLPVRAKAREEKKKASPRACSGRLGMPLYFLPHD